MDYSYWIIWHFKSFFKIVHMINGTSQLKQTVFETHSPANVYEHYLSVDLSKTLYKIQFSKDIKPIFKTSLINCQKNML